MHTHADIAARSRQRGAADCKNTLIGILAALDKLVEEDFKPERCVAPLVALHQTGR